jgi:hypothetical protein
MTTDVAVRPIKAGERQALTRLIKNDFETLVSELETLKLDALNLAHNEYRAALNATSVTRYAYMDEINEEIQSITKKVRDLEIQAKNDGYELSFSGYRGYADGKVTSVNDTSAKQSYEQRKQEIDYQYRKAIELLRRKKLDTERGLLLAAITTEEAKEFLDALPSAKEIFALAAAEN